MAILLPNVLVFGFFIGGINNNRNPVWRMIVGRYWAIEVVIFEVAAIFAAGCVLVLGVKWLAQGLTDEHMISPEANERRREEKQREIIEAERQASRARYDQKRAESKARFNALPEAERNRILEKTRQLQARDTEIFEANRLEMERAEQAKNLEEEQKRKLAASPQTKKRNAINDLIGGY